MTLSEWADQYAYLSPETSASPGKFKAFAYQNGMMDAVTDPKVRQITVIKSARVGYTKILDNVVGYFIHQDPAPILIVQPRVEDAQDYSRTEIAPMLRDTPVLQDIAGDLKAKDSNQRIDKRVFRNGSSVSFVGANSPGGFRRITARVVCFDEVDGYPIDGAGNEGDQITLGVKRTETFWNRKIILGSTPTIKDISRIERAYAESDQRKYHVPCPHCGQMQVLEFKNLRWDKDTDGNHLPETAHFVCPASGCVIEESSKPWMIDSGKWIAEKPFNGHAGFHIWAAYSLFPNACWGNLVAEFLRVKNDPTLLRTFINLVLGETWTEDAEVVDSATLSARGEPYGPKSIPRAVRLLTAGVDVQGNRIEVQVVGWGGGEESWAVDYRIIYGDPAQPDIWLQLDAFLNAPYRNEGGQELRIQAVCIDTGGHYGNEVLAFCKARIARRVWPIKGMANRSQIWPPRASYTKKHEQLFIVGVDGAKDTIYGRLRVSKPGPAYIHFPVHEAFNEEYFKQLTSERVVTKVIGGRPKRYWDLPSGKHNEALDTFVYALAARMGTRVRIEPIPQSQQKEVRAPEEPVEVAVEAAPVSKPVVRQPYRPQAQSWVGRRQGWLDR